MIVCGAELKERIFHELKFEPKSKTLEAFFNDNKDLCFYKYQAGKQHHLKALNAQKIWMGCAAYMDDDYDSVFIPEEDWEAIYQYMCSKEERFKEEKYARVMRSKGKVFQKDLYLCSLAETATNDDLWKRYGGDHSGFCIEYSAADLGLLGLIPLPVFYGDIHGSIRDFSRKSKAEAIFDIILKKDKALWEQQAEWRLIAWNTKLGIDSGDKGTLIEAPTPTKIICGKCADKTLLAELISCAETTGVPVECEA